MKTLSLLLVVSLATLAPASAAPAAAKKTINVRALVFNPDFPVELHAHDVSGSSTAGLVQIKSYLNHESNTLDLKSNSLVFTNKSNPASATDVNEVLGKVELPANAKSAIFVFFPETAEAGKHKSQVIAFDDSSKAFPTGSFKIVNASELPVKIELGKDTFEIAAAGSLVVAKPKFDENQTASMHAYSKTDDQWTLISTGVWSDPGTRRELQIIYRDLDTKQVELRGVRDVGAR